MSLTGISRSVRPRLLIDILGYPNEILGQILAELDYRDLLALRQTSHAFHDLVHTHESSLAQGHLESPSYRNVLLERSLLFGWNDLSQLVELSIRSNVSTSVATVVGERIASKLNCNQPLLNEDELKLWKAKKARKFIATFEPAMFVLYEYFDQFRRSIFEVAENFKFLSDEEYLTLGRVFELDQQRMIEQVKPSSLIDITEAWRALIGVCSAKGMGPSDNSRFTATIRSYLAYGDFRTFADLFCKASCTPRHRDRRDIAAIWNQDLKDDFEDGDLERPLQTIHHLRFGHSRSKKSLTRFRSSQTQMKLIEAQPLWEKPALAVMQRSGLVGKVDPHIPTIETWMRSVISEKGDPRFEFGRWDRPDGR